MELEAAERRLQAMEHDLRQVEDERVLRDYRAFITHLGSDCVLCCDQNKAVHQLHVVQEELTMAQNQTHDLRRLVSQ